MAGEIFKLNFVSNGEGIKVIDEPTGFDAADFVLDASVKSVTDTAVELSLATISGDIDNISYDCNINLKQKKALYELNFVRFAYRWKYKNGEYSTLSPFLS